MKKLFYFFLLTSVLSFGQSADSLYAEVDTRVANYPKSFSSVKAFAERIRLNFLLENAKVGLRYSMGNDLYH